MHLDKSLIKCYSRYQTIILAETLFYELLSKCLSQYHLQSLKLVPNKYPKKVLLGGFDLRIM